MKIIVADDQLSQRLSVAALLERSGHECILCSGGAEVLVALSETDASFVVSDVQMPDLGGLEVSREVRASNYGRYIYILLITASLYPKEYVQCLQSGADDFMTKPVDPATLTARLYAAARILSYDQQLQAQARTLAAARAQMDADVAAAGVAQRALLPNPHVRRVQGCEISYLFMPAHQVSGDMFNYFALDNARVGFYAADVAGHGVRSGLVAATLGHIISPTYFGDGHMSPGDDGQEYQDGPNPVLVAQRLNDRFVKSDYEDTYFTLVSGVIDLRSDTLSICQAGHPHPLLIQKDGSAIWLGLGGLPVGLFGDALWTAESIRFEAGTRLILHSDGITEAATPTGELYGDERLLSFVLQRRAATTSDLCKELAGELREWMGETPNNDDVTMIVIDR